MILAKTLSILRCGHYDLFQNPHWSVHFIFVHVAHPVMFSFGMNRVSSGLS